MTITTGPPGSRRAVTSKRPATATKPAALTGPGDSSTGDALIFPARAISTPAVLLVAGLLVGLGSAFDVLVGRGPGFGLTTGFLLACPAMALLLRLRALGTALISPPLLFGGAATMISLAGGSLHGLRRLGLDVATSLALAAPVLFTGTLACVVIVLARVLRHVARRARS